MRRPEPAIDIPLSDQDQQPDRGAVLVLVAVMLLVLMSAGAVAVDLASLSRRGQTLQNTADSVALTAVATWAETADLGTDNFAWQDAWRLFAENGHGGPSSLTDDDTTFDVVFSSSLTASSSVWTATVTVTDTSPNAFLAGFVGGMGEVSRVATAQMISCPLCQNQVIPLDPPLQTINAAGSGDGYVPVAYTGSDPEDRRFYAVNHHGMSTEILHPSNSALDQEESDGLVCVRRDPQGPCDVDYAGGLDSFPDGINAITDQISHTELIGNQLWFTGQTEAGANDALAFFCYNIDPDDSLDDEPCANHYVMNYSERFDFLDDGERTRGGGLIQYDGKLFAFSDDHKAHCLDPAGPAICAGYPASTDIDASLVPAPWVAPDQTGSGIDRILNPANGWIYYSIRARNDAVPSGTPKGVYLNCWDAQQHIPCSGFAAVQLYTDGSKQSGRLFFDRDTNGDPTRVCSTGIDVGNSDIVCTDDLFGTTDPNALATAPLGNLNALEITLLTQVLPADWAKANGIHTYHPPSNRLFLSTPRQTNKVLCYDFTTQAVCPGPLSGSGLTGGNGYINTANVGPGNSDVQNYGFYYEGDCLYGLGHKSNFWAMTVDFENGCDDGSAVQSLSPCTCGAAPFWGVLEFDFDASLFSSYTVEIFEGNPNTDPLASSLFGPVEVTPATEIDIDDDLGLSTSLDLWISVTAEPVIPSSNPPLGEATLSVEHKNRPVLID